MCIPDAYFFDMSWWHVDNNLHKFTGNRPVNDQLCCEPLNIDGLDVSDGYHDYVFSYDPTNPLGTDGAFESSWTA